MTVVVSAAGPAGTEGAPARRRVVFVHVMKTGGLALSHRLRELFDAERTFPRLDAHGVTAKSDVHALLAHRDRLDELDLVTVHMPAWVATDLLADRTKVVVLRDPVERTVSHLRHIARLYRDGRSLEELYDDPALHHRLVDHQARVLTLGPASTPTPLDVAPDDPDELARLRAAALPFFATALPDVDASEPVDLDRALGVLGRFDVVGTTERLQRVADRVADLLGAPRRPLEVANAAGDDRSAPSSLRRRIEADCRVDRELHRAATALDEADETAGAGR